MNDTFYITKLKSGRILFITLVIVFISFIDSSLVGTIFGTVFTDKIYGVILFTFLTVGCIFAQILFIFYCRSLVKKHSRNSRFGYHSSWLFAVAVEVFIASILLSITIQVVTALQYSTLLTSLLVTISQIATLAFFGILLSKLVKWFRSNRDSTVLIQIIVIALLIANVTSMAILHLETSDNAPKVIETHGCGLTCVSQRPTLSMIYSLTYALSFVAIWVSSIALLRNLREKLKKFRLWTLVVLPIPLLILSLNSSLIDNLINIFELDFLVKDAIYNILLNITGPLAGVASGLVFWYMSKNLYHSLMRSHIVLVAYGIIIILSLNYSTGFQLFLFPPYGIISASFMMLGSFGIFLGVYFSTIYVAQDSKLRSYIANPQSPVYKELRFFASTGSSENRERTVSNVSHVIKDIANEMENESGVPLDLEDDILHYVKLVLEEKKLRKDSKMQED